MGDASAKREKIRGSPTFHARGQSINANRRRRLAQRLPLRVCPDPERVKNAERAEQRARGGQTRLERRDDVSDKVHVEFGLAHDDAALSTQLYPQRKAVDDVAALTAQVVVSEKPHRRQLSEETASVFVIMSAAVTAEPTLESGGERDDWMTRQLATEFAVGSNLPLTWGACHCISSRVCGLLGARRLGHLAVLRARARPDGAPELGCVVGPYWPFTALVTLPLILGIETAAAVFLLPRAPGWLIAVWALCLAVLLGGLAGTSCRDPGVLRRRLEAST